ncbi:MAG: helix-turn-helix domain-containing protein [bacterium]
MTRYTLSTEELDRIMGLLYRLMDVRITFFDMQEYELGRFKAKPMSPYCSERRKNHEFLQKCRQCDHLHLQSAKDIRDVHIYHCHSGLLEGIVPLYDNRNIYLGAIVFGQLRDAGKPPPAALRGRARTLFLRLPERSREQVMDIGYLLKYVSEYIIGREMIRYRNKPWAETLEEFIEKNLAAKLGLSTLGQAIGKSTTFISHHFQSEFGQSPRQYILRRRMEEAKLMLQNGLSVQDTAEHLGFYDPFHFSKAFKKYWSLAPSTVRAR